MDVLENERFLELDDEDDDVEFDPSVIPTFLTERQLRKAEMKLEGKTFQSDDEAVENMNRIMNEEDDSADEELPAKEQAQELLYRAYDESGKNERNW